jgi:hypothetical protein
MKLSPALPVLRDPQAYWPRSGPYARSMGAHLTSTGCKRHDSPFRPTGAQRSNRPRSRNLILLVCDPGTQRRARGTFCGGAADRRLRCSARNCIVVACLTVNQLAYVMRVTLANRGSDEAKNSPERPDKESDARGSANLKQLHGQFDGVPSDNGQSNVAHEEDRKENAPT